MSDIKLGSKCTWAYNGKIVTVIGLYKSNKFLIDRGDDHGWREDSSDKSYLKAGSFLESANNWSVDREDLTLITNDENPYGPFSLGDSVQFNYPPYVGIGKIVGYSKRYNSILIESNIFSNLSGGSDISELSGPYLKFNKINVRYFKKEYLSKIRITPDSGNKFGPYKLGDIVDFKDFIISGTGRIVAFRKTNENFICNILVESTSIDYGKKCITSPSDLQYGAFTFDPNHVRWFALSELKPAIIDSSGRIKDSAPLDRLRSMPSPTLYYMDMIYEDTSDKPVKLITKKKVVTLRISDAAYLSTQRN